MLNKKPNRLPGYIIAIVVSFSAVTFFAVFAQTTNPSETLTELRLKIVRVEVENQKVRFGAPLKLRVTLQNESKTTLTIPSGSLRLKLKGWAAQGVFSSGWGTEIPLVADNERKTHYVIEPGSTIILTGEDLETTSNRLGNLKANYLLTATNSQAKKLLPNDFTAQINFEVVPSELIASVWQAESDARRRPLLPQIRNLLRQQAMLEDGNSKPWDNEFIESNWEYMGYSAIPLLAMAFKDEDPVVRGQIFHACEKASWGVANFNSFLKEMDKENQRPDWAKDLLFGDEEQAEAVCTKLAFEGLNDKLAQVRVAAIDSFSFRRLKSAVEQVKQLTMDADASVREAAQKYLSQFVSAAGATDAVVASLSDADARVSKEALAALKNSPEPPALEALKRAFRSSKDAAAVELIELLFEQENAELAAVLLDGFKKRSTLERLKIMTVIAGHADAAALELIALGLQDLSPEVQRTALMRLAVIPSVKSLPLIQTYATKVSAQLRPLAQAVQMEIVGRQQFPFARETTSDWLSVPETVFPSQNGTVPMVSPDGQWVAYVETGWGRRGGTGGMGRSNLVSNAHVVNRDGKDDRIVSDMFLVQWLSDSKKVASARDGFITITDLDGKAVTEFGQPLSAEELKYQSDKEDWRAGHSRGEIGGRMPHKKRLPVSFESIRNDDTITDWGENAAFSPDGKWFGPILEKLKLVFIDENGRRQSIALPKEYDEPRWQCSWSPDGKYGLMIPLGGNDDEDINHTFLIDFQTRVLRRLPNIDSISETGDWAYRKCRWNPWSKDGARLAFVRKGQIWVMNADGSSPRQITFDSTQKLFPVFSRDGKRLAYISWQPDNRRHYERMGPTDLWVVNTETSLATRITAPAQERINCLDWLDDNTLIFDRLADGFSRNSSLRVVTLLAK
jgi:hypothetical protein